MFSETKQALRQNNEHGWTINFSSVSTHMCLCCKHHRVQDEHMSSGRGGGRGPKVYHCSWMICLHQEPETDPLNDSSFWGAERKWKNRCWGQLSPGADVVSLYVVRPPAERRFGSDPECFLSSSVCFVSLFYSADNIMTWRCVWLKSCEGKQNNKLHGGRASCAGWVWFLLSSSVYSYTSPCTCTCISLPLHWGCTDAPESFTLVFPRKAGDAVECYWDLCLWLCISMYANHKNAGEIS